MNNFYKIINTLGYDSFYKGRSYSESFVKHIESNIIDKKYVHKYKVKSEHSNDWYDVEISNNGETLYDYKCNCKQFEKFMTCKHIAAVFINYIDEIFECEYIDELEISKNILKSFKENKKKEIQEKLELNLEFEFEGEYVYFKLLIGNNRMYSLSSQTKLENFLNSFYNKKKYEFGKSLTYDPKIHYFDKLNLEIIDFINDYAHKGTYYGGQVFFYKGEFETLLKLIKNKLFTIKNYGIINDIFYEFPTSYELTKQGENYHLEIEDFEKYKFLDSKLKYIAYNHNLYILTKDESNFIIMLKKNKIKSLTFENKDLNNFSKGLFKKIKNNLSISEEITEIAIPTKPEVKLYFDILLSKLICNLVFDYNGVEENYFKKATILRDSEFEDEIYNEMINYGFYEKDKKLIMVEDDLIYGFIEEQLPLLAQKYNIFTSKKMDNTKILKKVSTNSNFSIGQDGIMSYKFNVDGIETDELSKVFKALKAKKRYYKLKNNNVIDLNNEDLHQLNNLMDDLEFSINEIDSGNIEIPKYRALYIDSLKSNKYKNIQTNNLFDEFINNFKKYNNLEIKLDNSDNKILRDYQKEGVKWLTTIYKCDLGGILADEMGLGKSIQTISFIKQILKEKEDAKIIIVAPTSLIYNWQKEFEKFGKNLKYVVVADNKEKRKEILKHQDEYNIFITTYGLIRNDNDEYEKMDFELCVIDEAQMIKNYQANMTREVKKIKAKCKIALTGTPVENNVTELWSIFDFIMPGYLNNILKFKEKYNIKDVDEEGIKIIKNLNYQISPFILRRKKIDVAKSLPDKIENKIYIELPPKQKMLYLKELNDTKKEMDEIIAEEGFSKARMKILQLLMRLRQVCIDPCVMYENYDGESAKIDELLNIVNENIQNGHKILIFSSFKRVLENVKKIFDKNSISNYMIDGSVKSKNRMEMVEAFNKDDTNCFLITLKSGGTGLNLVGADTVIHLDIWWNPQVENQATDRAHRIGQTKKVTVIKMIMKGTIEERIIELQDKKKILSDNLIEGKQGNENLSTLTEKDIKKLLSYTED